MSDATSTKQAVAADDELAAEPTQAEIDAWVAKERARRKAWLEGPSDDERAAYAQRLKSRRLGQVFDDGEHMIDETMRRGLRYGREGQLAVEGGLSLMYTWSRHFFAELVKAGREWEEETAMPSRRRRVPFDDASD
ncbi:MAG TPA: hypothetical protein VIZ22_05455 [Candidatus Limnocylindrales bacterium]